MSPPRDWREALRLRAWDLKQQGGPQRTIAAALGATAGAVSQWLKRAAGGGDQALRNLTRPRPTILRVPLSRDHLSAISAISPDGRLFLMAQERALAIRLCQKPGIIQDCIREAGYPV